MSKILYSDLMEYSSDELAQASWVSSDGDSSEELIDSYSETNQNEEVSVHGDNRDWAGQKIILASATAISKIKFYLKKINSPTGNCNAQIFAESGGVPTGDALATSENVDVSGLSSSYTLITFTFATPYSASSGNYCIAIHYDSGDSTDYIMAGLDSTSPTHEGNAFYYDASGWHAVGSWDLIFYLYGIPDPNLQCYSESTIKVQGSYSLKIVAVETGSLNDTLTKTLTDYLDYSIMDVIKFDIRASRTGSNIKLKIHDTGGTTSEHTINIASADTWQTETWDISGITGTNRDTIDKIIIEIVNADSANTIYIDNLYTQAMIEHSYPFIGG